MSISLNLDAWCQTKKYVIKSIKHYNVHSVKDEYEVWLSTDVTKKIAGVKVDRKWKEWYLGKLRSFKTESTSSNMNYRTHYDYSNGEGRRFFDEGLEEKLGGNRQTLGSGL